jgi:hypothetical protein
MENAWNDISNYLSEGSRNINALQFLLIAIAGGYLLSAWGGVFIMAAGATLAHIIIDALYPMIANSAPFELPPLGQETYWKYLAALYVGYLAAITIAYLAKRLIQGAQAQHA